MLLIKTRGDTPWKIYGWNLQITHLDKENDRQKNLHDYVNSKGCKKPLHKNKANTRLSKMAGPMSAFVYLEVRETNS